MNTIITKQAKFENTLKDLSLYDEWSNMGEGRIAKVLEDGTIVIFVHESPKDAYSRYEYPPFEHLRDNLQFRSNLLEWAVNDYGADSNDFTDIAKWLYGYADECPLTPDMVYFPAMHLSKRFDYKDTDIINDLYDIFCASIDKDNIWSENIPRLLSREFKTALYMLELKYGSDSVREIRRYLNYTNVKNAVIERFYDENEEIRECASPENNFIILDCNGNAIRDLGNKDRFLVMPNEGVAIECMRTRGGQGIMSVELYHKMSNTPVEEIFGE